jgi:hypothetical protein
MMHTVTVQAIKDFDLDGRRVSAGEDVTVAPVIAASLGFRGVVSLLGGTYRTRDMVAAPVSFVPDIQPADPPAAKTRRRRPRKPRQ